MFHLRAFVSERLSAAAVDIFGEVEKSLSLYQVEVSRSREEIILLRQQLELLRDNNTDPLKATGGTMLDHAYIPPVLQENDQGPPVNPVDEEEESEDYRVGREFLSGPSEKTEHDAWTSCMMTQPNPETPQIKEEQDEFSIAVGVGPSPDVVKSEPCDRDEAEMELSLPPDDECDEESVTGDKESAKNREEVLNHLSNGHSKTPAGVQEHTCTVCGRAFARKYHLAVHVRTHSGEKPYACDICGKAFSHSSSLTTHRTCHTGEKPYQCVACDKLFSTSGRLKVHMRCHSGEKPYVCDVCGKRFSQNGQMTRHRRVTHGGERLYGCTVCGMRYKYARSLKDHLKNHERTSPNLTKNGPSTSS